MVHRLPLWYESSITLAAMAKRVHLIMIMAERRHAMCVRNETPQSRTDVPVPVLHMVGRFVTFSRLHLFFEVRQHHQIIERPFEWMLLPFRLPSVPFDFHEQRCKVKLSHLMLRRLGRIDFKMFNSTDKLIHGFQSEFREDLPDVFSNEMHEVDDMLRLSCKQLPDITILPRDADRTCVHVAHAHHDAAKDDERCCGECEFLRTERTCHRNIAAGHKLAVRFERHTGPQSVQLQCLMRCGEAELPRQTGVLYTRNRRGPRTAVESTHDNRVVIRLRYPCSDRTDAILCHQLH